MLTTVSPTAILKRITLSLTLFICTTLSIHFSAIKIPTPAVPCLQPFQKKTYISCHLLLTSWHSLPSILSPAHNKSPVPSYPPSQPPHCSFSPLFQHLHYQISVS